MQSLVAKNAGSVAEGRPLRMFKSYKSGVADGEQSRDFIYVKDCSAVVLWLLNNPQVSGLFNLGTGQARSFKDLMLALGTARGNKVKFEFVEMPESNRDQYQYFTQADMSKLRRTGYEAPFFSIEAGVRDYVLNYLSQADPFR